MEGSEIANSDARQRLPLKWNKTCSYWHWISSNPDHITPYDRYWHTVTTSLSRENLIITHLLCAQEISMDSLFVQQQQFVF